MEVNTWGQGCTRLGTMTSLRAVLGLERHPLHDERAAAEQIALLDPKSPEQSLRRVAEWLQSVGESAEFRPARRLAVIELLEQEGRRLERIVLPKFTKDPRLRNAPGGQAWAAAHAYRAGLAAAYASCAREVSVLAARALRARVGQLHVAMLHYEPIAPEAWRSLYRLYAACEAVGSTKTPAPAYAGDKALTTPLLELMKGLLVAIAAPERLPPGEVHAAYRIAERFAAAGRLEKQRFDGATHVLDLASGEPPSPMARARADSPGTRYLGAAEAVTRLEHMISFQEASMLDEQERLAAEYTPGQKVTVLRHFMSYWGGHPPRAERTLVKLDGGLSVVHGFRNVCGYLPHVATLAGNLDVKEDFELEPPETWPERDAGLHVVHAHAGRLDGQWAEVGDLAAIRVHDRSDWWLAVIRALHPSAGGLEAEFEVLTRKPAAVWLRVLGRKDRSAANWAEAASGTFAFEYTEAIVVPEPSGGDPVPSLVLPKGRFVPEQLVELLRGERSRLLRFADFLEQGADYDRCAFSWERPAP
jgi:hypothetical protein